MTSPSANTPTLIHLSLCLFLSALSSLSLAHLILSTSDGVPILPVLRQLQTHRLPDRHITHPLLHSLCASAPSHCVSSYTLDRNVTVPASTATSSAVNASTIVIYNDPGMEFPVTSPATAVPTDSTYTGLSYFVFQSSQASVPLQCPSPAPVVFHFSYVAVPNDIEGAFKEYPSNYALASVGYPIWSACMTGTMTLVGPYALPDITESNRYAYIVLAATGTRIFANATFSQATSISGMSSSQQADYTIFATATGELSYPLFNNGVGFTFSESPFVASGQFDNYVALENWVSTATAQ